MIAVSEIIRGQEPVALLLATRALFIIWLIQINDHRLRLIWERVTVSSQTVVGQKLTDIPETRRSRIPEFCNDRTKENLGFGPGTSMEMAT